MFPAGFYDIATDATGEIVSVQSRGIVEDAGVSVQNCVAEILRTTGDSGKVGAYKYRVQRNVDGSARMILLDNAIALQGLYNMLRGALAVENTVDALPDCEPDALFERFYRGDAAHSQSSGGCGIGLSAAQSIVQMHGGHIHASYPQQDVLRIQCELPQGAWRGRRRNKGNRLMKRAGKD